MKKTLVFLILGLFIQALQAEISPTATHKDKRIRTVTYDADNITTINVYFGYSTVIVFSDNEVIEDTALGDSAAWSIADAKNTVYLIPKEERANTNLIIRTNERLYIFMLYSKHLSNEKTFIPSKADKSDMFFKVTFYYPKEEQAKRDKAAKIKKDMQKTKAKKQAKIAAQKRRVFKKKTQSFSKNKIRNFRYTMFGNAKIAPSSVWDDGNFTHLRFSKNTIIPAIYEKNIFGLTGLVNYHVENRILVVHKIIDELILRKGKFKAHIKRIKRTNKPKKTNEILDLIGVPLYD